MPTPAVPSKSKAVLVVRRRSKFVKAVVASTRSRGIPSFPGAASARNKSGAVNFQRQEADEANEVDDHGDDSIFQNVECETLLVIQSLVQNPATSISIPFSSNGSRSVYAALPCQLYNALHSQKAAADVVVSRELQQLLHGNRKALVQLSAAGKADADDSVKVLLLAQDYASIARDSTGNETTMEAVEWFIKHLKDWKGGSVIGYDNFRRVHSTDPLLKTCSLDGTLAALSQAQVLMPCRRSIHSSSSSSGQSYQYWLPTWGVVLQAWTKAVKQVLALLKRSHYKERMEQALQQPHCPIPIRLVLDWLVDQGQVERVERASGTMIRLVSNVE
ncbi:hypothetical protein MPSEU_000036900 [Mayamaea pseudoterrestris]|nr:hypothetical protein MPSEU_000036900 [Mayamaea pseudoterrestris]